MAPDDLLGKSWIGSLPEGERLIGVVGSADRLITHAGAYPIGVIDGEAIVATPSGGSTTVELVDLHGRQPTWTSTVEGNLYIGALAGQTALLTGSTDKEDGDPGIAAIDTSDGTIESVMIASVIKGNDHGWSRTVLPTPSGKEILSSLCSVESDCVNQLVDAATGAVVRILPGKTPVIVATDRYGLTFDGTTAAGIDLSSGESIWKRDDQFGGGFVVDGERMISAWIDKQGGRFTLESVDLATGKGDIVLDRPASEDWTLWRELSTDTIATIGHGGRLKDVVLAGDPVIGSTVDLSSGVVSDDSVRLEVSSS